MHCKQPVSSTYSLCSHYILYTGVYNIQAPIVRNHHKRRKLRESTKQGGFGQERYISDITTSFVESRAAAAVPTQQQQIGGRLCGAPVIANAADIRHAEAEEQSRTEQKYCMYDTLSPRYIHTYICARYMQLIGIPKCQSLCVCIYVACKYLGVRSPGELQIRKIHTIHRSHDMPGNQLQPTPPRPPPPSQPVTAEVAQTRKNSSSQGTVDRQVGRQVARH